MTRRNKKSEEGLKNKKYIYYEKKETNQNQGFC